MFQRSVSGERRRVLPSERNAYVSQRRRGGPAVIGDAPRFSRSTILRSEAEAPASQRDLNQLWSAVHAAMRLAERGRNLQGYLTLCAAREDPNRASVAALDEWYERALDYYREHHLGSN